MKNKRNIECLLKKLNINKENIDINIFEESLTHSSYKNENKNINFDYERLEILGDSIVQKIVTEYLYDKYPNYNESDITSDRKFIVQAAAMKKAAVELDLINHCFLGKGLNLEKDTDNIKSDLFESIVGAIYLTVGENKCKELVSNTIIKYYFNKELEDLKDYKSIIQEIFQSSNISKNNKKNSIIYTHILEKDKFIATLSYKGVDYGKGEGKTKKEAEKFAAKDAYSKHQK